MPPRKRRSTSRKPSMANNISPKSSKANLSPKSNKTSSTSAATANSNRNKSPRGAGSGKSKSPGGNSNASTKSKKSSDMPVNRTATNKMIHPSNYHTSNNSSPKSMGKLSPHSQEEMVPVLDLEEDEDDSRSGELSTGGEKKQLTPNLTGDYWNIALLLVLYTLQGVPMGFASTVPLIMKERGVSYSLIGVFNLCHWPFSLKLLWAPLVDSCYSDTIGRRKTWLLPTQLLIGITLLLMSFVFDDWLGGTLDEHQKANSHHKVKPSEDVNITALTSGFFLLYFLCATQDVAVDGWSLTVLREENVGYQSMCNAAGQTLGYSLAFIGALSLQHFEILSFDMFMRLCGVIFIAVTVFVGLFKQEKPVQPDEEIEGLLQVYKQVLQMLKIPNVRTMIAVLLLWKIPYVGCEAIATLKLQEKGIPKEHVAYLGSLVTVVSVFVPFIVGKYTSGPRPLDVSLYAYIPRILMCGVACLTVFLCPNVSQILEESHYSPDLDKFPYSFYILVISSSLIGCFISTSMFCASMGMFARIAPKDIAGTYLTMLNMTSNLGSMWVTPIAFWSVDQLTIKEKVVNPKYEKYVKGSSHDDIPHYIDEIKVDGFYIISIVCGILGFVGFPFLWRTLSELQNKSKASWAMVKSTSDNSGQVGRGRGGKGKNKI